MPLPTPFPHLTFSSVLESDHATINRLAGRLKSALARLGASAHLGSPAPPQSTAELESAVAALRDEVVWRLVRHDVSEELVMRPAFEEWMGEEGRMMGEGDRKDHGDAKPSLHFLLHTSPHDPAYTPFVHSMMAELAQHMARESGREIPRLESILPRDVSAKLARDYARTQMLTPKLELLLPARDAGARVGRPVKAFATLESYIDAPAERFRALWEMLPVGAVADVDGVLIDEAAARDVDESTELSEKVARRGTTEEGGRKSRL